MKSLILSTTIRYIHPLFLLFSLFVLTRGHNDPGGGFIGGLVAAAAFALYALSAGVTAARRALRVDPHLIAGVGLLVALSSGMWALFRGQPFMTGQWLYVHLPALGVLDIGTPIIFDVGVYLVVSGITLLIILSLAEE